VLARLLHDGVLLTTNSKSALNSHQRHRESSSEPIIAIAVFFRKVRAKNSKTKWRLPADFWGKNRFINNTMGQTSSEALAKHRSSAEILH